YDLEYSASFFFQMILTVFLSNNEQILTEVPITPETTCRDVVEFCKEPGEGSCHLAEVWRGNEQADDLLQDNVKRLTIDSVSRGVCAVKCSTSFQVIMF
ncbi:UNVERIFIED_CONTAM: hypothetical protein H355_005304, partial [Colinus virginianus]